MLLYLYITIFIIILLYRFYIVKEYRFFYLATAFVTIRIWVTFFSAMLFASSEVYLYEIESYSSSSMLISIIIIILSVLFLVYEKIFKDYLSASVLHMKKMNLNVNNNIYAKNLSIFALIYFSISAYLFISIYNSPHIGSAPSISKFNIVEQVNNIFIFKVLYALNPFVILLIAYGYSVKKFYKTNEVLFYNKFFIIILITIGFIFHSLTYGYLQAKSHFILTYIMFFVVPVIFFNKIFKLKLINRFRTLLIYMTLILLVLLLVFYMHYGEALFTLLGRRLLLEGQFLFVTLYDYINGVNSLEYFNSFPSKDDAAIIQLMYMYIPSHRILYHEETGWLMSGAMPGYNFLFNEPSVGLIYWFFNLFLLSIFVLNSLKRFIKGNIITSFILIKIYWYIMGYIALGWNYLYRDKFWFLITILITIIFIDKVSYFSKKIRKINV